MANIVAGKIVLGEKCKLYLDELGVGEGTWAEVDRVGDVSLSQSHNEVEINERAIDEVGVVLGKKNRELTFQLTRRPGNEIYDAFLLAFRTKAIVGMAVMSHGILLGGAQGYQADMYVTKFDDNQATGGAIVDVALKRAADSDTAPADVTVVAA